MPLYAVHHHASHPLPTPILISAARTSFHACAANPTLISDSRAARLQTTRHALNRFDETNQRDPAHYAALISSHSSSRRWEDVLAVFVSMLEGGVRPDKFLLPKILKSCAELRLLRTGASLHGYLAKSDLELDVFVGNSIVDMYAKCGDLMSSRAVFDGMAYRDVVSWTALVKAYADAGLLDEANGFFESMQENGVTPDLISWNAMISGFARNGEIEAALCLLDEMLAKGPKPGANSWNGVISGCVQNGFFADALDIFRDMILYENLNAVTIASIFPACSGLKAVMLGQELHAYAIRRGIKMNVFLGGSLIDMYFKCGKIDYAERVFMGLEERNVTVWNEMIAAYAGENRSLEVLELIRMMVEDGIKPNVITYNTILTAYAREGQKDQAFELMDEMSQMGLKPNVVSMNGLISGFSHSGLIGDALELFRAMQYPRVSSAKKLKLPSVLLEASIKPNAVTIASVLAICADVKLHQFGKEIHCHFLRNDFASNFFVLSGLVDMYAKCGDMASASRVFEGIVDKSIISWNTLMSGYNHNSEPEAALILFLRMLEQGFDPSSITLMNLLWACSKTMALGLGRELHGYIIKFSPDGLPLTLVSALIDMYAKCGSIIDSRLVFEGTIDRDIAVWNAMLSAYSSHRMTLDSIHLFEQMEQSGIRPDHITFTAVLSACNQEGFREDGFRFYKRMEDVYGISPTLEHITCMVDIMCSAGLLEESFEFITRMPFEPDACVWATLLKACRLHSNHEIGERAARALFELEPNNTSSYIVLHNIFAMAGMWDSAIDVRSAMSARGLKMPKACSWINLGCTIHSFKAGDSSHPKMEKILTVWDKLANKMVEAGYIPQSAIFHDEGELDHFSCCHTEKLAVCLGIISLRTDNPIRVSKNIRMCMDCHSSTKLISKMEGREIFVRDGSFFHHFKDGKCSCRDVW